MVTKLSHDDSQQLQRTVEMFEAIVDSQPGDYQSLEILRDAYEKLGQAENTRKMSVRLASALTDAGQTPRAIKEIEHLLKKFPNDIEARTALAMLQDEAAAPPSQLGVSTDPDSKPMSPAPDVTSGAGTPLVTVDVGAAALKGAEAFARILIAEKILTEPAKAPLMDKLKARLPKSIGKSETLTLFQLMVEEQLAQHDDLLALITTKSSRPYLPLSTYDVDRDIAFLLPRNFCFEHCIVPFDVIGRSALIATVNPFDHAIATEAKQMVNYSLFWYVSPPQDILATLRRVHGIDGKNASKPAGNA